MDNCLKIKIIQQNQLFKLYFRKKQGRYVIKEILNLLHNPQESLQTSQVHNPHGDGHDHVAYC